MAPANSSHTGSDAAARTTPRAQLDLLLAHVITVEQFEAGVTQICQADPDEVWALLALLDQYHRRGLLATPLFRTLKAAADRLGLGRNVTSLAGAVPPPTAPTPATRTAPPPAAPSPLSTPPPAARTPSAPAAAPGRDLPVGTVLRERYVIEERLGGGAGGTLYRARDRFRSQLPAPQQCVALKVLRVDTGHDGALADLRQGIQQAQTLSHPNIVNVHELDRDGSTTFMTMELLDVVPLSSVLEQRSGKPLPRAQALAIIRDVGAALLHAQQRGVVHGDLQPRHILLTGDGEVRVKDFAGASGHSTYASRELAEDHLADARDDLYALSCIAYELLCGHQPFQGMNAAPAHSRHLHLARPAQLSHAAWQALRTGLAWRREGRNIALATWLEKLHLRHAAARLPPPETLAAMPGPRRHPAPVLVAGGALALALLIAGVLRYLPAARNGARHEIEPRAMTPVASPAGSASAPESVTVTVPAATPGSAPASANGIAIAPPAPPSPARTPALTSSRPRPSHRGAATPDQASTREERAALPAATVPAPAASAASAAEVADNGPPRFELVVDHSTVLPGDSAARLIVRRRGSLEGHLSFVWSTEPGTAQPNRDYVNWGRRVEHVAPGVSSVTLLIPIVGDISRDQSRVFYVMLSSPGGGAALGSVVRAAVQIAPGQ